MKAPGFAEKSHMITEIEIAKYEGNIGFLSDHCALKVAYMTVTHGCLGKYVDIVHYGFSDHIIVFFEK